MADLTSLYPKQHLRDRIIQACVNKYISLAQKHREYFLEYNFFEVLDYKGGAQPPKSQFINEPREGYIRFLQIRDFTSDNTITYIPKNKKNKTCKKDDVLLGRYGASVGKILRGKEGAYNVACAKIIVLDEDKVSKDFLFYFFHSSLIQDTLKGITRGAQAGFNKKDIAKLKVLTPKWEVQTTLIKILQQVDNYLIEGKKSLEFSDYKNVFLKDFSSSVKELVLIFKKIDFLQLNYSKGNNLLIQLRQAILQEAVLGKLVPQDLNDEPASILLEKIKKRKTALVETKKIRKGKPLPPISEEEISFELPAGWGWSRFGDLVDRVFDGPFGSNLKTSDYTSSGVRVVRLENLDYLGFKKHKKSFVSIEKYELLKKHSVFENDIIFGSFIADGVKTTLLPNLDGNAIAKADCFCIRYNHEFLIKELILFFLSSHFVYGNLIKKVHGMTRMRINTTQLKKIIFPLPPLAEQKRIVKKVKKLFTLCDTLESEIKESEIAAEKLMQSVLQEAFGKK